MTQAHRRYSTDTKGGEEPVTAPFKAFDQDELLQKFTSGYTEFLRRPGMSLGIYTLPVDGVDHQHPHSADEVYVVLKGRGALRVRDERIPVGPGSIVSVDHGEDHGFVDITEDLQVLVVFAPAENPDDV
jgi:mannose-6-phosphate isomerase-like protein (cupin superfamily)